MAIRSDNFLGIVLTGEDAEAFQRQINESGPNEAAQRALSRGDQLLARFGSGIATMAAPKGPSKG